MEREGSPGHPAVLRGGLGLCGRGKNTYRRNRHVRDVDVDVENLDVGHDRTARAERGQPSTGAQGAQGGQLDDVRTLGQGTDTARVQRQGKREIGRGRGGRAGDGEPVVDMVDMVELDHEEDWGPPGDEPWLAYCECTHPKGAATALVWTRESTGRGSWVCARRAREGAAEGLSGRIAPYDQRLQKDSSLEVVRVEVLDILTSPGKTLSSACAQGGRDCKRTKVIWCFLFKVGIGGWVQSGRDGVVCSEH